MKYINNALEPSTYLPRLITISIYNAEFSECSIELTVINRPDAPVITTEEGYQSSFTEDSAFTYIAETANISITDEDSVFLYQARVEVENTPTEYGPIVDSIIFPNSSSEQFLIEGNGTGNLIATAKSFTLRHNDFINLIKSIRFMTDDQATNVTRNVSVVVEEYPLDESGASSPARIPVNIIQKNDRPVFGSPLISEDELVNFLPAEIANPGFFPSYLATPSNVFDADSAFPLNPDIIGLSIHSVSDSGIGVWQYKPVTSSSWHDIHSVSHCMPQFLGDKERIRFLPSSGITMETTSTVYFNYSVWDGTSTDTCNGNIVRMDEEVSISTEEASFVYTVQYTSPIIYLPEETFTFTEESNNYPLIFRNLSILAETIVEASIEIRCKLCTENITDFEIVRSNDSSFEIQRKTSNDLGIAMFTVHSANNDEQYWNVTELETFLRSLKYVNTAPDRKKRV